ncbi:hypothetical protein [Pseudomonas sp. UBA1879]|nr:hypothetical protein [Pseudomonas sp. UBA1879]
MHCKHIVKYFTLLLVFSAGLAWTDPLTSGTTSLFTFYAYS